MRRNTLMIAATAGLLGLSTIGGSFAVAQSTGSGDDAAEVQAFLQSSTSVAQAIQAAESASGGTALNAEFDDAGSGPFYEVDTINGDKLMSVTVDAASGTVTEAKNEGLLSQKTGEDDDDVSADQVTVSLAEAVSKAEAQSGSKVMAVGYEAEDSDVRGIEIELAAVDGKTQVMVLDPATGTLAAVADMEGNVDADHEEDENEG